MCIQRDRTSHIAHILCSYQTETFVCICVCIRAFNCARGFGCLVLCLSFLVCRYTSSSCQGGKNGITRVHCDETTNCGNAFYHFNPIWFNGICCIIFCCLALIRLPQTGMTCVCVCVRVCGIWEQTIQNEWINNCTHWCGWFCGGMCLSFGDSFAISICFTNRFYEQFGTTTGNFHRRTTIEMKNGK